MLRTCYIWLLNLHPAPFRQRFAKEMLAIFDEVGYSRSAGGLLIDAAVSLVRQWMLRPEVRNGRAEAIVPIGPVDVPTFVSLDNRSLRPVPLLTGCILSLALLCALITGAGHSNTLSWIVGSHRTAASPVTIDRSSLANRGVDTLVRFGAEPGNPWRAIATHYFKAMPVLRALDADSDLTLSPAEIANAPDVLRQLDKNHDGKLSPEECGFFAGSSTLSPGIIERAKANFMRRNPVLATLDSDHNGEVSSDEIRNSSQSLRKLDISGDGFLSSYELIPNQAEVQAGAIFGQLDFDHDGLISAAEWEREESAALRELLMRADRNHDGFTTMTELTDELLLREQGIDRP